jgi:predicted DsbA family dithiol-disulfide isomerase
MPTAAPVTLTEAAEAILIALAEKAGVDRKVTQRALKISERTYYRRRCLPGEVAAAREAEEELTRDEAACR